MATPPELAVAISELAVLADNDLRALWRQVSTADEARDALREVLPGLVGSYALASATITADWYDDLRDLVEARGRFAAIPSGFDQINPQSLAGFGVAPLYQAVPDWHRARTLVKGGMQLRIATTSRQTVIQSSIEDPSTDGWMRQGSGECGFCAMLIGRGAVYSESSGDFGAHDNCRCSAVPAFRGQSRPVKPYQPSLQVATDADRARVRDWIASNL